MPSFQWRLVVITAFVAAPGQFYFLSWSFGVRDHFQQMRDAIEPRFSLIVRADNMPGRMPGVGRLEHLVPCSGIFVPAAKRFEVHGAELPLTKRIFDPCLKSPLLLFFPDFHPKLDENDAGINDIFLKRRT